MKQEKLYIVKDNKGKEIGIASESVVDIKGGTMQTKVRIDGHTIEEADKDKFDKKKQSLKAVIDQLP